MWEGQGVCVVIREQFLGFAPVSALIRRQGSFYAQAPCMTGDLARTCRSLRLQHTASRSHRWPITVYHMMSG